jgi:membrane-associated phospholipid phosphatase
MDTILNIGVNWVAALQGLGGWLLLPMKFFSFLGTEEFYMLVLPVLYWCIHARLGIQVAFILMISGGLNDAFKLAFHGPRPYWYSTHVKGLALETSFGVPSGHAQNAMSVWGVMAAGVRKWWGWLVAGLVVFFIGLSRLYLGVHFPHDVLLGWLIGGLILWLLARCWDPLAAWLKKCSPGQQIILAFLASLVLIVLPLIPYFWLGAVNWQPPQTWAQYAGEAVTMEGVMTTAGTFFGLALGLVWLERKGGFEISGKWWQLVLRYLLGVAGVLAIRYGLKAIFPEGDTLLAYALRYIRYALIGAWLTGGAPLVFIWAKLADKARIAGG